MEKLFFVPENFFFLLIQILFKELCKKVKILLFPRHFKKILQSLIYFFLSNKFPVVLIYFKILTC